MHKFQVSLVKVSICAIPFLYSNVTHAQSCEAYVGQTPKLTDIEAAIEQNTAAAPKGEFETTVQYEERKKLESQNTGALVIPMELKSTSISKSGLEYDTDREVFKLTRYAFAYGGLRVKDLWGFSSPLSNEEARSARMHISLLAKVEDKPTGVYQATNAFGRKSQVIKSDYTQWGIYDRPLKTDYRTSYKASDIVAENPNTGLFGEIPVPLSDAKQFKGSASVAFVVIPQAPWSINYRKPYPTKPTVKRPFEEIVILNVLFGDVKCASSLRKQEKRFTKKHYFSRLGSAIDKTGI